MTEKARRDVDREELLAELHRVEAAHRRELEILTGILNRHDRERSQSVDRLEEHTRQSLRGKGRTVPAAVGGILRELRAVRAELVAARDAARAIDVSEVEKMLRGQLRAIGHLAELDLVNEDERECVVLGRWSDAGLARLAEAIEKGGEDDEDEGGEA